MARFGLIHDDGDQYWTDDTIIRKQDDKYIEETTNGYTRETVSREITAEEALQMIGKAKNSNLYEFDRPLFKEGKKILADDIGVLPDKVTLEPDDKRLEYIEAAVNFGDKELTPCVVLTGKGRDDPPKDEKGELYALVIAEGYDILDDKKKTIEIQTSFEVSETGKWSFQGSKDELAILNKIDKGQPDIWLETLTAIQEAGIRREWAEFSYDKNFYDETGDYTSFLETEIMAGGLEIAIKKGEELREKLNAKAEASFDPPIKYSDITVKLYTMDDPNGGTVAGTVSIKSGEFREAKNDGENNKKVQKDGVDR